ncbi:MAG: nuclear transport factor 2 family protein [Dyadobacter sp.]
MDDQKNINRLYKNFNDRDIDALFELLHTNVTWPNGWEGGNVHGHDDVRAYWLRQWQEIAPSVVPISFDIKPGGEIAVHVHQVIKDLSGQILSDSQVIHTYTFENGKVRAMVIE